MSSTARKRHNGLPNEAAATVFRRRLPGLAHLPVLVCINGQCSRSPRSHFLALAPLHEGQRTGRSACGLRCAGQRQTRSSEALELIVSRAPGERRQLPSPPRLQ